MKKTKHLQKICSNETFLDRNLFLCENPPPAQSSKDFRIMLRGTQSNTGRRQHYLQKKKYVEITSISDHVKPTICSANTKMKAV